MSLATKIEQDLVQALKSKDTDKVSALRMVKAALINLKIDKKKDDLADQDVISVIQKEVKQHQESLDKVKFITKTRQPRPCPFHGGADINLFRLGRTAFTVDISAVNREIGHHLYQGAAQTVKSYIPAVAVISGRFFDDMRQVVYIPGEMAAYYHPLLGADQVFIREL